MSGLVAFHRLLIATAILFCLGYAVWEARAWLAAGPGGSLAVATVFALLAAALAVYLWNLDRVLRSRRNGSRGGAA